MKSDIKRGGVTIGTFCNHCHAGIIFTARDTQHFGRTGSSIVEFVTVSVVTGNCPIGVQIIGGICIGHFQITISIAIRSTGIQITPWSISTINGHLIPSRSICPGCGTCSGSFGNMETLQIRGSFLNFIKSHRITIGITTLIITFISINAYS